MPISLAGSQNWWWWHCRTRSSRTVGTHWLSRTTSGQRSPASQ
jgi:hypothetical protein